MAMAQLGQGAAGMAALMQMAAVNAPPAAADPELSRTVHIGNLGPLITPDMLRTFFGYVGTVTDCRVAGEGKYAFIEFQDPSAANAALVEKLERVFRDVEQLDKSRKSRTSTELISTAGYDFPKIV